jgi:branched-chain amino acid transport system permease protein
MDFYFGLGQTVGIHTLLGLSAYIVLLTGQVSLAQAAFFAIGAYAAGMLTVLAGWHVVPALSVGSALGAVTACAVGIPALRVKGLMLVVATLAFGEGVRLFFFNFDYQVAKGGIQVGPLGGEGFRQIRFFPEHGWTTGGVMLFIWVLMIGVVALLWWFDRSRYGAVLRAVGEDEVAAQSVGINLTAVKVSAMTVGGAIAGLGGGLYAHYTTHIVRHRLPDRRRIAKCLRHAGGGDLRPGIPRRRAALPRRLAQPPLRRAHRAGDEPAAARPVREARCLSSERYRAISAACVPSTGSTSR